MGADKAFAVHETKHASGNIGYRVDSGLIGGKRSFKSFATEAGAAAFQRKCPKAEAHENPLVRSDIDAITRQEVLAALSRLREQRASITEAVDFSLKHARPVKAEATIQAVTDEFNTVKEKAGLSAKHLTTAKDRFFAPFRDGFKKADLQKPVQTLALQPFSKGLTGAGEVRATARRTIYHRARTPRSTRLRRPEVQPFQKRL